MKAWLITYNLASALGWAYVLLLSINALKDGKTPAQAWAAMGQPLLIVQSTMAFEIVHALVGMVPSPVFVTAMQVSSRLWVIWGATHASTASQEHWSLYLMVISWCIAEIPRYLFYVFNLAVGSVPFPIFFVRYSSFMVLYPAGITGEIFQCLNSLEHWSTALPVWGRMLKVILVLYAPGSPFMINNMLMNRKSAFKKRSAASNPKPVSGLVWPIVKAGDRGSTPTNKAIFEAAIAAVDQAGAQNVKKEKNWRFGYVKHVEANVRASMLSSDNAITIAESGLAAAHKLFQFERDGKAMSLGEAMDAYTDSVFETVTITGSGKKAGAKELAIPYAGKVGQPYYLFKKQREQTISGDALKAQLKTWVQYGVIEEDTAVALAAVADHPDWLDLSRHHFVLLGAGSAMGPLPLLLAMGANVFAVDIHIPRTWERLIKMARASSGDFTFPVRSSKLAGRNPKDLSDTELAAIAGADLLNDTPELATWLTKCVPEQRVTVGNYTYLDGPLHVQLAMACDAIISKLALKRKDLALAFLCTPTDCHAIPKAAHEAAAASLESAPFWQRLCPALLVPNAIKPVTTTDTKEKVYLVDGTVAAQGPNYILAKRLQHWRCIVEFSRGHTISSNIAPSTATASVVHNASFAAAYGGMHLFTPMEVMYQETSNAVMGALLVHDVRNPEAPARGGSKAIKNPIQIFQHGGFHGGTWRCGFKMGSIGEMSAVAFYLKTYGAYAGAGAVGFLSVMAWVVTGRVAFMG